MHIMEYCMSLEAKPQRWRGRTALLGSHTAILLRLRVSMTKPWLPTSRLLSWWKGKLITDRLGDLVSTYYTCNNLLCRRHTIHIAVYNDLLSCRCHLPMLYIGLEYGLTNNSKLAERFFSQALSIAPEDPFVIHEVAVVAFQNGEWVIESRTHTTTRRASTWTKGRVKRDVCTQWW